MMNPSSDESVTWKLLWSILLIFLSIPPKSVSFSPSAYSQSQSQSLVVGVPKYQYFNDLVTRRMTQNERDHESDSSITGVTLKMAFDTQGGVADLGQEKSERFTCSESLDMVHRLRRDCHAVVVGRKTVECDDCTLTVRRVAPKHGQPIRVVVDPLEVLELSQYKIATDGLKTLIYHHDSKWTNKTYDMYSSSRVDEIYPNVQWIGLPSQQGHTLSARDVVHNLQVHHGLDHIMVEGGPSTARQFLQEKMVDRAILVFTPRTFQIPVPSQLSRKNFEEAGLELIKEGYLGVDRVEYWSRPGLVWPTVSIEGEGQSSSFWP